MLAFKKKYKVTKVELGRGAFSTVRLGMNRETKDEVSVSLLQMLLLCQRIKWRLMELIHFRLLLRSSRKGTLCQTMPKRILRVRYRFSPESIIPVSFSSSFFAVKHADKSLMKKVTLTQFRHCVFEGHVWYRWPFSLCHGIVISPHKTNENSTS